MKPITCFLLVASTTLGAPLASAEQFLCESSAQVSIDKYTVSSSADESGKEAQGAESKASAADSAKGKHSWIVDTRRGWRRSDVGFFGGSCVEDQGYIVCKEQNLTFGEATLSLHPDHRNFLLVYMDYGLDALAFVGSCSKYPN